MRRYWLCVLAFVCLFPLAGRAQGTAAIQDHCYLGGTQAKTSGLNSTNYLNGIVPKCTVTVYLTGTQTKATLSSDSSGTPLSNPFFANAVGGVDPGGWVFWATVNQGYDIVMSGGVPPNTYATPVTLTDRYPGFEFSGGGSTTPCGNIGMIQIASANGTALDCDPNFFINKTTHERTSTASDTMNAVTSLPRAVYDPVDTKFDGGLAAAIAGTSGFTPTQVLNATIDYAYCQTKTQNAKAGWIITPAAWTIPADGVKLWPNQRLGGESTATATFFDHPGNVANMISNHSSTDTIVCNGTTYTPGTPVNEEVSYIAESGRFTGSNDIGVSLTSGGGFYVHDVTGWGVGFAHQAILVNGTSSYVSHIGVPTGQLKGCQDYINGIATGTCSSVELRNLDGNADYIYASDGASQLSGHGPGPCYPNCSAIGIYGGGTTASFLFAQVSDIGIINGGVSTRGGNWRVDATSMEGVRFTAAGGGAALWGIKVDAPCLSDSLQSAYSAGTPTGCFGVYNANASGGGSQVMAVTAGGDGFFGTSYIQCEVGDAANSFSGAANTWGLIAGQGNPSNATSNDLYICGQNNQPTSGRVIFYNAGTPITASTTTININGITSLWLANGLDVTNFTYGVSGQKVLISAGPNDTATIEVSGNFRSCNGLPVTVTNDNPLEAVDNAFTGRLDMVCNPPNPTPWHVNYLGNATPSDPSLLEVYGDERARILPGFSIAGAVQLHGPAAPSGQACFVQESVLADGHHVVSSQTCTAVDLSTQTAGEIFTTTFLQTTPNLWMVSNSEPNGIAIGKFPAPAGGFWDGPTTIAAGGNGATAPAATENNTGITINQGILGPASAPSGACSAGFGGETVLSQDGHATWCPVGGGTWTTKF